MNKPRSYPWYPFTVNSWLAVDSDGHVCFVESFVESGMPEWIVIPNHYLSCLWNRLYFAAHLQVHGDYHSIVQGMANQLGVFFLITKDFGYSEHDAYIYEAIPEQPRKITSFPPAFAAIAGYIRLCDKRLINRDTIAISDWGQGGESNIKTLSCGGGILLENATEDSSLYKLPQECSKNNHLVQITFLPNMYFENDIAPMFPTFVEWNRYKTFFEEFIEWFSERETGVSFQPVNVDSFGLPERIKVFRKERNYVGYTFMSADIDSFLVDHVGEVNLTMFSKDAKYSDFHFAIKKLCQRHGFGMYEYRRNAFGKALTLVMKPLRHLVSPPRKQLRIVLADSNVNRVNHTVFLATSKWGKR